MEQQLGAGRSAKRAFLRALFLHVSTQRRDKTARKQKVVAPACAGGSQRVACAVVVVECELAIVVCLGGGAAVQLQLFGSEQGG